MHGFRLHLREDGRHHGLRCLALALLALTGCSKLPDKPVLVHRDNMPNVVLITMDTVRADHYTSRLAATHFPNAYSTSDWTLPSHASIFTGKYPSTHGAVCTGAVDNWLTELDPKHDTLAELLGRNGYRTAAVVANSEMLDASSKLDQGFHYYNSKRADVTAEGVELIETAHGRGEPLFLFLNYMEAHAPYTPPVGQAELQAAVDALNYKGQAPDPKQLRQWVEAYDRGIAQVERQIGIVVAKLQTLGIYDNTLLIVTSDHGEAFGENGLMEHPVSVYQNQIHVPLVIKYPRQTTSSTVTEAVSGVDLLPTILEIAGVAVQPSVDGVSLLHLPKERFVYAERFPCGADNNDRRLGVRKLAAMQGDRKLIWNVDGSADKTEAGLAPAQATVGFDLRKLQTPNTGKQVPVSPERLERLKSNGYAR